VSVYGRFFQLGYVVRDIDAAVAGIQRRMGAEVVDVVRDLRDEAGNEVALLNLSHLAVPGAEIELIEPRLDWPSIYLEALPDNPGDIGFHHLGFLLPDQSAWDRAIESCEALNTPVVMEGGTSAVRFAYIDTRRQAGHYSEIVLRFDPANARALP
jgi:hypothetical protein